MSGSLPISTGAAAIAYTNGYGEPQATDRSNDRSRLWQVSGRADTTYNERLMLDYHYVSTLSIRQDVLILCRTVAAVILGNGAC